MKLIRNFFLTGMVVVATMAVATSSQAQTITGNASLGQSTEVIKGDQIPAPVVPFGGVIKPTVKDSKIWWPPRIVPAKGAPNVLLILTDDQGYGVPGTFGGVVPTPSLDRVAKSGLRYTQFNSTALCSPTRAALLTGRNHHTVGNGVIGELSTGYPGYNSIMGIEHATIANILKGNGYATAWFGKNHNTPGFQYSVAGPFDQWPSGMGFDYFYGFMGGETDQYTPYLFRDHKQITPWIGKPDYNLTTDLADEAVNYLKELNAAAPEKPFFLYYASGASHSPHQPTPEWLAKFKGKFDMGWNVMREQIFENQKRLGVIPADTRLTEWPDSLPKWDSLTPEERKLFARQAEAYAAYTAYNDYEIGRVIQQVQDMGKLDNTIVIYIHGDNGTSPEGTTVGTPNQWRAYNGILDSPIAEQMESYDKWGSAETYPHMAVAWSWAFDTPFMWTKQVASHFGGTRQGMAISWPGHIKDKGGVRNQFHHVIDIMPTILEATGVKAPKEVNGIKQKPIEGTSMAYTFNKANVDKASARKTQYFEMIANRGIYHEGWYACTTPPHGPWILNAPMPDPAKYKWELYDLTKDYSQANNLAEKMPAKLQEMQKLFDKEAKKYNVYPLSNDTFARATAPRPSPTAGKNEFTYNGVVAGIPTGVSPSFIGRNYTITAEVDVPAGGGDGMLVTSGGRFGGYALYLLKGKPVFNYNMLTLAQFRWEGQDALAAGKHTIVYDFTYAGPGIAKGGMGVLSVDGKVVAKHEQPNSIAFVEVSDETFDIGIDTRTGVNDADYKVPFAFNGKIDKLTFKIGPSQIVSASDKKSASAAHAKVND